jgi:hypothetical protein
LIDQRFRLCQTDTILSTLRMFVLSQIDGCSFLIHPLRSLRIDRRQIAIGDGIAHSLAFLSSPPCRGGERLLLLKLNAWLAAPATAILPHHLMNAHILQAVDSYDPTTEAVLLMESFVGGASLLENRATFFYLKNLPITPPQCYEQVRNHWDEFLPGVASWQDRQLQNINPTPLPHPNCHPNQTRKY